MARTTRYAAQTLRISPRRLRYWKSLGLLGGRSSSAKKEQPKDKSRGRPSGSFNMVFENKEVTAALLVKDLLAAGCSLRQAKLGIQSLHDYRKSHQKHRGERLSETVSLQRLYLVFSKRKTFADTESDVWKKVQVELNDNDSVMIVKLPRYMDSNFPDIEYE